MIRLLLFVMMFSSSLFAYSGWEEMVNLTVEKQPVEIVQSNQEKLVLMSDGSLWSIEADGDYPKVNVGWPIRIEGYDEPEEGLYHTWVTGGEINDFWREYRRVACLLSINDTGLQEPLPFELPQE